MHVKPKQTVEQINFLASAKFHSFTYQADKSFKAGEIYPSNDADAVGIVINDVTVDATTGTAAQPIGVIVEGYILKDRLTEAPTEAAEAALNEIKFR